MSKSGSAMSRNDTIDYAYNSRCELTNALARADVDYNYAYVYDDIGNRISSTERGTNSVYEANELNQYTAVDDFTPEFDDDGNQTLVKTATGIWRITYNGENRPICWVCDSDNTILAMTYDHLGRRREKRGQRFFYDSYLQVADNDGNVYAWDPTESVATRPLKWRNSDLQTPDFELYYAHDGNKNVSAVVAADGSVSAHYEYAPFGTVATLHGASATDNPWRFSCEYAEVDTATVYYNYRHYEPEAGRWSQRDPLSIDVDVYGVVNTRDEQNIRALFLFSMNSPLLMYDHRGLDSQRNQQIIDNILLLGSWWNPSCARCGPDITDSLKSLKNNVSVEFDQLKKTQPGRARSSCSIFSPGSMDELIYATTGWDILGLAFSDVRIRYENGVSKCPFGNGCSETVMVNGKCHWKWSVNYLLFGWMAKLCDCPKSRMTRLIRMWKATKPKDYGKIANAVNFAESAYDGFPDSGTVLEEPEYSHCKACDKLNANLRSAWPRNADGDDSRR